MTNRKQNERNPLHSSAWGMSYGVFAIALALMCLVVPFPFFGALLSRNFEGAAALGVMGTAAALSLRTILRADNAVWMTPDGIEFGNRPTRIPWRHVVDATPWLYGAPGFHVLSFSDGTPDLRFIGSADTNERLHREKSRWLAAAPPPTVE